MWHRPCVPASVCVCVLISSSDKDPPQTSSWIHLHNVLNISAKTLFPNKVIFTGTGVRHIFLGVGHNSILNIEFIKHCECVVCFGEWISAGVNSQPPVSLDLSSFFFNRLILFLKRHIYGQYCSELSEFPMLNPSFSAWESSAYRKGGFLEVLPHSSSGSCADISASVSLDILASVLLDISTSVSFLAILHFWAPRWAPLLWPAEQVEIESGRCTVWGKQTRDRIKVLKMGPGDSRLLGSRALFLGAASLLFSVLASRKYLLCHDDVSLLCPQSRRPFYW